MSGDAQHGAAIETESLSRAYGGTWALYRLDLEVGRGEILGFLGPNGAGNPRP